MTDVSSAKDKLARSRAALLAAMGHGDAAARVETNTGHGPLARWWRRSHLSTATELATPLLQRYASKHPARLVGYAAGVGSLVVLVRPWRLLSLGMVLSLLVRTTDLPGIVSSYLVPQLGDTEGPRDDFLERPPG